MTDAYRTGARVVRRTTQVAALAGGWLLTELPPHVVTAHALSTMSVSPFDRLARSVAAQQADRVLHDTLHATFGARYDSLVRHPRRSTPSRHAGPVRVLRLRSRYTAATANIAYADGGVANHLDVWRRPDLPDDARAPVLFHIPGGAWTLNDKRGQGYSVLSAMVQRGWVGVSINYRRSPRHAWPAHIVDVKRAIAWVKENIDQFGGDPEFIAVTGGSAGGHLSALAALTGNRPELQPGFEAADTAVQAAVPLYGVYDLTDPQSMHPKMLPFLEKAVMKAPMAERPDLFAAASPISHVTYDAPPFFVLHGQKDSLIPAGQAQRFTAALKDAGAPTVAYTELPNTHHAFDFVATVRTQLVAEAIATFLGITYSRRPVAAE